MINACSPNETLELILFFLVPILHAHSCGFYIFNNRQYIFVLLYNDSVTECRDYAMFPFSTLPLFSKYMNAHAQLLRLFRIVLKSL